MQHATDVGLLLYYGLWKIERDWNRGRIKTFEELHKRAMAVAETACERSKKFWDAWLPGIFTSTMRDLATFGDPFRYWLDFWNIFDMYLTIRNTAYADRDK